MKKYMFFFMAFLMSNILAGCGVVSDEQALQEFKSAYPNATVYKQFVGEGDSDTAYVHFLYTETGSKTKKEVMWQYQRQEDNSWKTVYKSKPKPPGSDFGD